MMRGLAGVGGGDGDRDRVMWCLGVNGDMSRGVRGVGGVVVGVVMVVVTGASLGRSHCRLGGGGEQLALSALETTTHAGRGVRVGGSHLRLACCPLPRPLRSGDGGRLVP